MPGDRGHDITSEICEGREGKPVTKAMKKPGSKRKKIKIDDEEADPKVVESQFKYRQRFIKEGNLDYWLKYQLKIKL